MTNRNRPCIIRHMAALAILVSLHVVNPQTPWSMEIDSVNVQMRNNEIRVSTALKPDQKFIRELSDGLSKELVVYIDLFRVWKVWPNEFVHGVRLTRIIKSDPVKREYVVSHGDGSRRQETRFADLASLTEWVMRITEKGVTPMENLEEGTYFIKITVESQIKKLPPVVGYFLFFIPEKEFSVSRNSPQFQIPGP